MKSNRIVNFDILRVLSMFMIVLWHFCIYDIMNYNGNGGRQGGLQEMNISECVGLFNFIVIQLIVIFTSVGVNCFVLLSGYFMVEKDFQCKRLLKVWVQVVFYTFALALLVPRIFDGSRMFDLGNIDVVYKLTPIRDGSYWFISRYFGMMFLAPFLSKFALSLDRKSYRLFLVVSSVLLLDLFLDFPYGRVMDAKGGYSLIWFIYLFFVAGYIRINDVTIPKPLAWFSCIGLSMTVLLVCFYGHIENYPVLTFTGPIPYNGFTFFLSVALFFVFKQHSMKRISALAYLAPYTFAVYLIHCHGAVSKNLANYRFPLFIVSDYFDSYLLPCVIIGKALIVFLFCVSIDVVRKTVFRLIYIDSLVSFISYSIDKSGRYLIERISRNGCS